MTQAAVLIVVLTGGIVTGGWPGTAHAQPSVAGQAESVVSAPTRPQRPQDPDPGHDNHPALQQPPSAAANQPTDPPVGRGTPPPLTPIPEITDADRAAAFPDVEAHSLGDDAIRYFVLFDQLEWQGDNAGYGMTWDSTAWVGRDLDRLWIWTEGEADDGRLGSAEAHLLYGRAFARWWDVVVGVRQDVQPGPAQSWLAFGLQGLAPYWFEVEATAYLGAGGRTAARLEAEYELLLTNRLVLQPLVEANLYGRTDMDRGIDAGLSTLDAGFRLRYELQREFAPYVGLTWNNTFGGTAGRTSAAGGTGSGRRYVVGLRLWF